MLTQTKNPFSVCFILDRVLRTPKGCVRPVQILFLADISTTTIQTCKNEVIFTNIGLMRDKANEADVGSVIFDNLSRFLIRVIQRTII